MNILNFNPTGVVTGNLVTDTYTLSPSDNPELMEVIIPTLGLFHTTIKPPVVTTEDGFVLPTSDYTFTYSSALASEKNNIVCYGGIVILNKALSGRLIITTNYVGGEYQLYDVGSVDYYISSSKLASNVLTWGRIANKPKCLNAQAEAVDVAKINSGMDAIVYSLIGLGEKLSLITEAHDVRIPFIIDELLATEKELAKLVSASSFDLNGSVIKNLIDLLNTALGDVGRQKNTIDTLTENHALISRLLDRRGTEPFNGFRSPLNILVSSPVKPTVTADPHVVVSITRTTPGEWIISSTDHLDTMRLHGDDITKVSLGYSEFTTTAGMFSDLPKLAEFVSTEESLKHVVTLTGMFKGCTALTKVSKINTPKGKDFTDMFNGCSSLITVARVVSTAGETFDGMFMNCVKLTTISEIDTKHQIRLPVNMFKSTPLLTNPSIQFQTGLTGTGGLHYKYGGFSMVITSPTTPQLLDGTGTPYPSSPTSVSGQSVASVAVTNLHNGTFSITCGDTIPTFRLKDTAITKVALYNGDAIISLDSAFSGCTSLTSVTLTYDTTSLVTTFDNAFSGCSALTTVNGFDTGKGISFRSMFKDCTSLTTIPRFDTSKGTNFESIFANCSKLSTIPLLNTSCGTEFNNSFKGCVKLNAVPLLNTSSGTGFNSTFYACVSLTTFPQLDLNTGTTFNSMFEGCTGLTTLPKLATIKGTNFEDMFKGCTGLTTIEGLDTRKGTTFTDMFTNTPKLQNPVTKEKELLATAGGLLFSNADFRYLYNSPLVDLKDVHGGTLQDYQPRTGLYYATSASHITSFKHKGKVTEATFIAGSVGITSAESMYKGCTTLTKLNLHTNAFSNVSNKHAMFEDCASLTTMPTFDASNCSNFRSMFKGCTGLTTLPKLATIKGTNFEDMFKGCTGLTTIEGLDTRKGTTFTDMFTNTPKLQNPVTKEKELLATAGGLLFKNLPFRYLYKSPLEDLKDITGGSVADYQPRAGLYYATSASHITSFKHKGKVTEATWLVGDDSITSCHSMYEECGYLRTVAATDGAFANTTICHSMFKGCQLLANIPVMHTSNCTDFSKMFYACYGLKELSKLDTRNSSTVCTDMFIGSYLISPTTEERRLLTTAGGLDFTNHSFRYLYHSQVNDLTNLTGGASRTTVVRPGINYLVSDAAITHFKHSGRVTNAFLFSRVSTITSAREMYKDCASLTELVINHSALKKCTDFGSMFEGCASLLHFKWVSLMAGENFNKMFKGCTSLISTGTPGTGNGTNFEGMYDGCSKLEWIDSLDTRKGTSLGNLLRGCNKLSSPVDREVALITTPGGLNFVGGYPNSDQVRYLYKSSTKDSDSCVNETTQVRPGYWYLSATGGDVDGYLHKGDVTEAYWCANGDLRDASFLYDDCDKLVTYMEYPAMDGCYRTMENFFNGCSSLETVTNLSVSGCNKPNTVFTGCTSLKRITPLKFPNGFSDCDELFIGCTSLIEAELTFTPYLRRMSSTFEDCSSLTTVTLHNTSTVRNISSIFKGCEKLVTIRGLETGECIDFTEAFNDCASLVTSPYLDTAHGTEFEDMFKGCTKLLTITALNTLGRDDYYPQDPDYHIVIGRNTALTRPPEAIRAKLDSSRGYNWHI